MESKVSGGERKRWDSPIFITVVTALVGIIGTGAGAVFQGYYEASLEKQKFESNLIFKALEPEAAKDRANYLLFLANSGLIDSLDVKEIRKIANDPSKIQKIPSSNPELNLNSSNDILAVSVSVPGELKVTDKGTWTSWNEEFTYASSREYKKGRILAFGHDDILRLDGNQKDIRKSLDWLSGSVKNNMIAFSAGHCEWVPAKSSGEEKSALFKTLENWGYKVKLISENIDSKDLEGVSVLIVGNSWGSFSDTEIRTVENFLSNGGGLFTAGLGWAWRLYAFEDGYQCSGNSEGQVRDDISTYPMNKLMSPYGVQWTPKHIVNN